jgi:hypothetical protein
MSNGYNTSFKNNPVQFMSGLWWDINSTGINGAGQANYALDVNSVGDLDLFSRRNSTLELRDFANVSFWDRNIFETSVRAYYLNSRVDNTVRINVLRHAEYFFTDTLTGCTFIAYGNSRAGLVCEHVNSLNNGSAPLRRAELAARMRNSPVCIIYSALDYRAGGLRQGERGEDVVATVFGRRLADGWHFYARRRINSGGQLGQRVLDAQAYEI